MQQQQQQQQQQSKMYTRGALQALAGKNFSKPKSVINTSSLCRRAAFQLTRLLAHGGSHGGSAVICRGWIPNCMHEWAHTAVILPLHQGNSACMHAVWYPATSSGQ
jgi:hypothetical protein